MFQTTNQINCITIIFSHSVAVPDSLCTAIFAPRRTYSASFRRDASRRPSSDVSAARAAPGEAYLGPNNGGAGKFGG